MKRVIIWGSGSFAKDIYDAIVLKNTVDEYDLIGFIDDFSSTSTHVIDNKYILGNRNFPLEIDYGGIHIILGFTDPKGKEDAIKYADLNRIKLATFISSQSHVSPSAKIGDGSVIQHYTHIGHDARIGRGVRLGNHCHIHGETTVEDFASISPYSGISSNCVVKKGAFMAVRSTLLENVTMGEFSFLGAGSFLKKDLAACQRAVGFNPRVIK